MNQRQAAQHCTLEGVASVENLFLAAAKARRGKSRRPDVVDWWLRRESELLRLREELLSGGYRPGPYRFLLATREGVPFCGFRFLPGLRPRMLGATKRRFERRRTALAGRRDFARLSVSVFAWYQFSREGNSAGLRRAYARTVCVGKERLAKAGQRG